MHFCLFLLLGWLPTMKLKESSHQTFSSPSIMISSSVTSCKISLSNKDRIPIVIGEDSSSHVIGEDSTQHVIGEDSTSHVIGRIPHRTL